MQQLTWHEKDITIAELNDCAYNPRRITKKAFDKLVQSIKQDGYHARITVDCDNNIIAGHQRKAALLAAGYNSSDKIKVLCSNRALSKQEYNRINIRDNLEYGDFDTDILANNFELDFLKDIGMDITFDQAPAMDLEAATLDDVEATKLCKRCPYKEVE